MSKYDYSKENLEKLAKESWCESEMCYKLTGQWRTKKTLLKYIRLYNIDTSHWRKILPKVDLDDELQGDTNLQKQIIELRKQNKSFNEIAKLLNCSKSTVSHTLRKKTKEKNKQKNLIYSKSWKSKLIKCSSNFCKESYHYIKQINKDWKEKLRTSTSKFKLKKGENMKHFGYKDVLNKYNNQTKIQCYLTGDWIDLTKDDFAFDHIVPVSKGGACDLDNLGITTYIANQSKSNMTVEEYIELCKKVLIHHGYKVEKL